MNKKEFKIAIVGALIGLVAVQRMLLKEVSLVSFLDAIGEKFSSPTLVLDFLIKENYIVINNSSIQLTEKGLESGTTFIKEFNKNETNKF